MSGVPINLQSCSTGYGSTNFFTQLLTTLIAAQCTVKPNYPSNRANSFLATYDFIVVGAGSAGATLAGRLSDNPAWNILVIEAGDDPTLDSDTPLMVYNNQRTSGDWQFLTEPESKGCKAMKNNQCAWPRGRMLGGSSSINGMLYQTGNKRDYDQWQALTGVSDWNWNSVEKYFIAQLTNELSPTPVAPQSGAIENEVENVRNLMLSAASMLGFRQYTSNLDRSRAYVGYSRSMLTVRGGTRQNTARAYLAPRAGRNNLHVIKNGFVRKVLINPKTRQARGVELLLNGRVVTIGASRETIVSAGTINTPQILMLSGVGPRALLSAYQIPVLQDLPAVGRHLFDHSNTILAIKLRISNPVNWGSAVTDAYFRFITSKSGILTTTQVNDLIGYINTDTPNSIYADMGLYYVYVPLKDQLLLPAIINGVNLQDSYRDTLIRENQDTPLLLVFTTLLQPKSEGTITLRSNNPMDPPVIRANYNTVRDDVNRIRKAIRHVEALISTPPFRGLNAQLVRFNLAQCDFQYRYDTDDYWNCYIEYFTSTLYHPVGTSRMGTGPDSVVDPRLRVQGIRNLRVVDGSVMPYTVGANTNAPIIMIGEKAADIIRQDYS